MTILIRFTRKVYSREDRERDLIRAKYRRHYIKKWRKQRKLYRRLLRGLKIKVFRMKDFNKYKISRTSYVLNNLIYTSPLKCLERIYAGREQEEAWSWRDWHLDPKPKPDFIPYSRRSHSTSSSEEDYSAPASALTSPRIIRLPPPPETVYTTYLDRKHFRTRTFGGDDEDDDGDDDEIDMAIFDDEDDEDDNDVDNATRGRFSPVCSVVTQLIPAPAPTVKLNSHTERLERDEREERDERMSSYVGMRYRDDDYDEDDDDPDILQVFVDSDDELPMPDGKVTWRSLVNRESQDSKRRCRKRKNGMNWGI